MTNTITITLDRDLAFTLLGYLRKRPYEEVEQAMPLLTHAINEAVAPKPAPTPTPTLIPEEGGDDGPDDE